MKRLIWLAAMLAMIPSARSAELPDVLKYVPGRMNTVAVINVREINKSPRAVKEEWSKNHETEYMAGALAVPPWAHFVVIGAELYPGELAEGKSLALVPVNNTLTSTEIAQREGGTTQLMGDKTVILSPRRGYVAIPTPGIVAVSSTLPRQEFSRWLTQPKPEKVSYSAYIQEALAKKSKSHIVVATDLTDIFDPQSLRLELLRGGITKEDPSLDAVTQAIMNIRGVTITVQIGEPSPVEIDIDFKQLLDSQAKAFQSMLPKIIDICGFEITEVAKAEVVRQDKMFQLKTTFSDKSLRRLLSVINSPADAAKSPEGGTILTPKDSAALASSMRYYRAINTYLDDLRTRGNLNMKANDYSGSALWYETYSNKIDKLPIQDVDPELLQYGSSVTAKLRSLAGSLRGLKLQLDAYDNYKSVTTASSGGGFITPRGRVGIAPSYSTQMDSNVGELSARQAELVVKTAPDRVKVWEVLDSDRSAVRRNMLEKYKIDFDNLKK
ncbi:hypothetical protein [Zavarzinella formosa]|uniref:hypothetical protein n=1 Tax=Zavarzinella formosa TaxID=360055 RepID=UPI000314F3D0|nr:hypothetical protein [Zavarzinella formosa]